MDQRAWGDFTTPCLSVSEFSKTCPLYSDVHDMEGNIIMLIFFVSANTVAVCLLQVSNEVTWGWQRHQKNYKEIVEVYCVCC